MLLRFAFLLLTFSLPFVMQAQQPLKTYCQARAGEFAQIPADRKANLQKIADYLNEKIAQKQQARLTFICTHNSRRSQFAQVWASVANLYYGFLPAQVAVFSGGTEATACNPRTVSALQRAGVQIEKVNEISAPITIANNPRYAVLLQGRKKRNQTLYLFSKKYQEESNPTQDFCAVLVCSQADEACPAVFGAEKRLYHGYEDPKKSDNTEAESLTYDETCRLIAREMLYVFSLVKR